MPMTVSEIRDALTAGNVTPEKARQIVLDLSATVGRAMGEGDLASAGICRQMRNELCQTFNLAVPAEVPLADKDARLGELMAQVAQLEQALEGTRDQEQRDARRIAELDAQVEQLTAPPAVEDEPRRGPGRPRKVEAVA